MSRLRVRGFGVSYNEQTQYYENTTTGQAMPSDGRKMWLSVRKLGIVRPSVLRRRYLQQSERRNKNKAGMFNSPKIDRH